MSDLKDAELSDRDNLRCFVCFRLAQESRITDVLDAEFVVGGVSVCATHTRELVMGHSVLVVIDMERERLVWWWDSAIEKHGEWNRKKQRFEDGSELAPDYWMGKP